jgi:hypothetical protein
MRIFHPVFALGLIAFAAEARSQTIIQGEITGVTRILEENTGAKAKPMRNVEIQIQRQDGRTPPVLARPNMRAKYFIGTLSPGLYTIKIFVDGNEEFAADKLKTRLGDPLRIDYNMRTAVVSMSNATSKKTRRFAWQEPVTGTHLGGRWIETYAVDGYEAPFAQVERKSGFALQQAVRGF